MSTNTLAIENHFFLSFSSDSNVNKAICGGVFCFCCCFFFVAQWLHIVNSCTNNIYATIVIRLVQKNALFLSSYLLM